MHQQCKSWAWGTGEYEHWALATCPHGYIFNLFWLSCFLVGSSYLFSPSYKLWPVCALRIKLTTLCSKWNCRSCLWGCWLGKGQTGGTLRDKCSPEDFWGWPFWDFSVVACGASPAAMCPVLSRVLCLSLVSQRDSGAHGDRGIASACGHGWVVVVYMLRLSPAGLPSEPHAGTVSRQSKAGCPVKLFHPENCSSLLLRHPWYIKTFI